MEQRNLNARGKGKLVGKVAPPTGSQLQAVNERWQALGEGLEKFFPWGLRTYVEEREQALSSQRMAVSS
jgi:hypothetical protein